MALLSACAPDQTAELEPLPEPDLTEVEPAVRTQLDEQRAALEALLGTKGVPAPELARGWGNLGMAFQAYDLLGAAAPCLRNARALDPGDARWPYYVGMVEEIEGNLPEAAEAFEAVLALDPSDLPARLRLAGVRFDQRRLEDAEAIYREVLGRHPDGAAAQHGLGRIAETRESWAEAARSYERALDLQPAADRLHYALGQVYRRLGETEKARGHLERSGNVPVAFEDPRQRDLLELTAGVGVALKRGGLALLAGQTEHAVREFRRAVEVDPESAEAHQSLGSALARAGDLEGAVTHYLRCVELQPANAVAHMNLGILYGRQGRDAEALESLRRAVELEPSLTEARLNLGIAFEKAGRWDAALAEYDAAREREPENVDLGLRRALTLLHAGRRSEAEQAMAALRRSAPGRIQVLVDWGTALAEAEDLPAAERAFRDALGVEGTEPADRGLAHYNLALALQRRGAAAEALGHLQNAVELAPELTEARFYLAGSLAAAGRWTEAAVAYRRVAEAEPGHAGARLGEATALLLAERYGEARARLLDGLETLPRETRVAHTLARLLAACPDANVRDGERALDLATQVFEADRSIEHAETVAMAYAAAGRFDEAIQWQQAVLRDAHQAGLGGLVRFLEADLERYRAGRPAAASWLRR